MTKKASAAASPADLGGSEFAALFQHTRSLVYRSSNAVLQKAVAGLTVALAILGGALAFTVMTKQPPMMFYVTDDLRVVPATPLTDASMLTRERITTWAQRALIAPWAFDYENYRAQINGAMDLYFSEQGAAAFIEGIVRDQVIENVRKNNYVVTMSLDTAPVITGETGDGQNKAWRLTARAKITYKSSRETRTSHMDITAVIVRDNDKLSKGRFIAISQYVMVPVKGGGR